METINFVVTVDQEYSFGQIKDEYVLNLLRTDNVEELVSFVVRHIIRNNIIAYTFSGPTGILRNICNKIKNQKYTAKLKINNNRIIEVEGLKGHFKCEVMNCDFVSEKEEAIDFKINYCKGKFVVTEETSGVLLGKNDNLWEAHFCVAKEIESRKIKNYRVFSEVDSEQRTQLKFDSKFVFDTCKPKEQEETDEQDCCDECLSDDQELTKDLMTDEIISFQKFEIERLMNIVQDLVTTNLRLVEIIGLKK